MYRVAGYSYIGLRKKTNQDSCCAEVAMMPYGDTAPLAVCDGAGGLSAGEMSSCSVIRWLERRFETSYPSLMESLHENVDAPFDRIQLDWEKGLLQLNAVLRSFTSLEAAAKVSQIVAQAEAIARMSEPGTGTLRRRKPKFNTPAAKLQPKPKPKPKTKAKAKAKARFVLQLEDESDATSVISGEEEATTIITNEEDVTVVENVASDEKAVEVPVEEPKAEEPAIEEPPAEERMSAELQTPEWFRIVQKIVLTESADFVRVEQGEGHA